MPGTVLQDDVVIDDPDGTSPTWTKTGNPDLPVCYTKGAKPSLFGKIQIEPPLDSPTLVALRVRVDGEVEAVCTVTVNGAQSNFLSTFGSSLAEEVKTVAATFEWQVAPVGTPADGEWASAGTSGDHVMHFISAAPKTYASDQTYTFECIAKEDHWDYLYDLAVSRACGYVDGETDIVARITAGIDASVFYDPEKTIGPNVHPGACQEE